MLETVVSPANKDWGQSGKKFVGVWGRKSPSGSRSGDPVGARGRSPPEAEAFSLSYMIILTFLIMKSVTCS